MPLINGRFYANPAFGRALERARAEEAAHGADQPEQRQTSPAPTDPLANRIYNESSGLRTSAPQGPGSAEDLHNARLHMAQVIRNREAARIHGGVAPDRLRKEEAEALRTYPPAREAFQDSQRAAQRARTEPDRTAGATHFYLDYGEKRPDWAVGKRPVAVFGPFLNEAGGSKIPRGANVKIVVLP